MKAFFFHLHSEAVMWEENCGSEMESDSLVLPCHEKWTTEEKEIFLSVTLKPVQNFTLLSSRVNPLFLKFMLLILIICC